MSTYTNPERNRTLGTSKLVNKKQLLSLYILTVLQYQPDVHGLELYNRLNDIFVRKNLNFPLSNNTLYETLVEMMGLGYIVGRWEGGDSNPVRSKRFYRITDLGVNYLNSHLNNYIEQLRDNKIILDTLIGIFTNPKNAEYKLFPEK